TARCALGALPRQDGDGSYYGGLAFSGTAERADGSAQAKNLSRGKGTTDPNRSASQDITNLAAAGARYRYVQRTAAVPAAAPPGKLVCKQANSPSVPTLPVSDGRHCLSDAASRCSPGR